MSGSFQFRTVSFLDKFNNIVKLPILNHGLQLLPSFELQLKYEYILIQETFRSNPTDERNLLKIN